MSPRLFAPTALCAGVALLAGCITASDTASDAVVEPVITVSEPERVAAADDPFNAAALSTLAPGMIVALRVAPAGIELEQAYMMLTPKVARRADGPGDRIVATLSGGGAEVSQTAVGDPAVLIEEQFGEQGVESGQIIRQEERSVALALPTPSLVDTLDVTVTATGQTARFDVSAVMEAYCASAAREPSCQRTSGDPVVR